MAPDPPIQEALREVSAQRSGNTIEKLAGFITRHTMSISNPGRRPQIRKLWRHANGITSEFERYATECGGCLEVKTDTFIEQPGGRVSQPTEIQNVYAILRGSDPKRETYLSGKRSLRFSQQ
jgi:hypothetical protein